MSAITGFSLCWAKAGWAKSGWPRTRGSAAKSPSNCCPPEFTTDAGRVRRFAQEARAASALNHPNIITIHEIGEAPQKHGSTHYIVTEYVEGETLRQRMTSAPQQRIEPSEAIDIAAQIAAALAAAHEAGIAHRDIKPENVMVRRDGYVKVLDFGLAKLTEAASRQLLIRRLRRWPGDSTEAGVVMGTPRYMSPEQARGEKVDARTDIFSLGVMLYEMIAGRAPFAGATTSETIAAILRDEPPPLTRHAPEAPPNWSASSARLCAKTAPTVIKPRKICSTDLKELKQRIELQAKLGEMGSVFPPSGGSSGSQDIPPEGGTTNKRCRAATFRGSSRLRYAPLPPGSHFNRSPVLTEQRHDPAGRFREQDRRRQSLTGRSSRGWRFSCNSRRF